LNDELHAARWARKLDSFRPSSFGSPDRGPVGLFHDQKPTMLQPRLARVLLPMPASLHAPVPVVQTYTGMEEALIECVIAATGAHGLVVEGTGAGNIPGSAEPGVKATLDMGLPVALATRTMSGGCGSHYGGQGGGVSLRAMGVLEAGALTAAKARLLLMTLLATVDNPRHVRDSFTEAVQILAPV
jgi:L-asparaginase